MSINELDAKCANRGDVEYFRYICKTEDGYYVWLDGGNDSDPGFAVWYNDSERAKNELDTSRDLDGGGSNYAYSSVLRLCVDEKRGIAVLKSDLVEGLVYVFANFDWRPRKVKGLAFMTTRGLLRALTGYFGKGKDALTALALIRLCKALRHSISR